MSKNETLSTLENENMSNTEDARTSNEVSTLQIEAQTTALSKEQEQASNIYQSGDVPPQINSCVTEEVDKNFHKKPPKKKKKAQAVDIVTKEGSNISSEIWGHFTRLKDSNPPRAACNYCSKSYAAHPKLNGTTSMWTHLESSCKKYPYKLDKSQKTLLDYKNLSGSFINKGKTLNVEEIRTSLVKMIIIDELPFRIVEGEGFKLFCEAMEPRFQVSSRHTIARDCMKLFLDEKKKMKRILKNQRVCLTTDTWTSIQNLNYMCLTAHWISSDWKLEKRIINFCIVENHKGETIAKQIEECLIHWGIDKVFTITVDNATSNDRAINHLKRKCKWKDSILNNDYMHARCCAHIVNLIVKEGLEEQNEIIMRIRNAVKYVRSSPARLNAYKKCVEKEKIDSKSLVCLDVETRWNSTYMMLEAAEKFEKAFERFGDEDKKYMNYFDCYELNQDENTEGKKGKGNVIGPPVEFDWIVARNFVKFLKIFYNVTLKFSGSSYITSNIFFRELAIMHVGLSNMINKGDYHMISMTNRMKEKLNKYWGSVDKVNWLLFVVIVLDPRYKLKYVDFVLSTIYEKDGCFDVKMADKVEEILNLLYKQYESLNSQQSGKDENTRCYNYMLENEEYDISELLESQFAKHLEEEQCVESKSELSKYLLDGCEKSSNDFDILNWWKVNTSKYHVLSNIARDVLAIPVSTIASESTFSTSGRVIDPFRSSLSPKMVEAPICSQDWLRGTTSLVDLRTTIEDDAELFQKLQKELEGSSRKIEDDD